MLGDFETLICFSMVMGVLGQRYPTGSMKILVTEIRKRTVCWCTVISAKQIKIRGMNAEPNTDINIYSFLIHCHIFGLEYLTALGFYHEKLNFHFWWRVFPALNYLFRPHCLSPHSNLLQYTDESEMCYTNVYFLFFWPIVWRVYTCIFWYFCSLEFHGSSDVSKFNIDASEPWRTLILSVV